MRRPVGNVWEEGVGDCWLLSAVGGSRGKEAHRHRRLTLGGRTNEKGEGQIGMRRNRESLIAPGPSRYEMSGAREKSSGSPSCKSKRTSKGGKEGRRGRGVFGFQSKTTNPPLRDRSVIRGRIEWVKDRALEVSPIQFTLTRKRRKREIALLRSDRGAWEKSKSQRVGETSLEQNNPTQFATERHGRKEGWGVREQLLEWGRGPVKRSEFPQGSARARV